MKYFYKYIIFVVKFLIKNSVYLFFKIFGKWKLFLFINETMNFYSKQKIKKIVYKGTELKFVFSTTLLFERVKTFSTKEPETLEWIDNIPTGSVLWDIGANIGLYSCYAAISKKIKVVSFEPSVFNLEILARNIYLNNLCDLITIVPLPLSDKTKTGKLRLSSTSLGGAMSTFDNQFGFDGNKLNQIFEYSTNSITMDDAIDKLCLPSPDYIKLDVDGIEHLILSKGINVLKNTKGIILEINKSFTDQFQKSKEYLINSGFKFSHEKNLNFNINNNEEENLAYNQVWIKK